MFEIVSEFSAFICVIASIIGLIYGIDRVRKGEEDESSILRMLAMIVGIVIGIINIILIYSWVFEEYPYHWLIIVLIMVFGTSLLGDPLKDTPIAAIIAIFSFIGLSTLLLFVADFSESFTNPEILDIVAIPLWVLLVIILLIVGVIFIVTLFTEFTIDRMLQLISWSPLVVVFSLLLLIQALLMILLNDPSGIMKILGITQI